MSIVKDVVSGIQGAKAAKGAANAQMASANQAAAMQEAAKKEALGVSTAATTQSRADFQPYAAAGTTALTDLQGGLSGLNNLITNPNAQKDYVTNNPFFESMAGRAKSDLFNNAAARGKVGSGSTAEALQNSLLLLGSDLVNQNVSQRGNLNTQYQGLVNTGLNAAGQQSGVTQAGANRETGIITGTAQNVGDLRVQSGNAQAGGIIGAYNARQGAADNAEKNINQAAAFALCDRRTKENIREVGKLDNGLPVYLFNYMGDDKIHMNVMAQDVEKVNPSAVTEIDGLKHIDMGKICQ